MGRDFVACQHQADQSSPGRFCIPDQRLADDERVLFEIDGKAEACFESIDVRTEVGTGDHQARLDPKHVQRLIAHGLQTEIDAGPDQTIPD